MTKTKTFETEGETEAGRRKHGTKSFLADMIGHVVKGALGNVMNVVGAIEGFCHRAMLRGMQKMFAFFLMWMGLTFVFVGMAIAVQEIFMLPMWVGWFGVGLLILLIGFIVYAWSKK